MTPLATSERVPITALILAKNEEQNIGRCVAAVHWCDEIVVVDDGSTDATAAIAIAGRARVLDHRFESFAKQRNWALDCANIRNEWILHLDADEVATPAFAEVVWKAIQSVDNSVVAFALCRKTMLLGRWLRYSDGFPVWIMRLTRKGCVKFEDYGHGEVAVPSHLGNIPKIKEPFLHYQFSKGLSYWIERHNRYSTMEAELELEQSGTLSLFALFNADRVRRRVAMRNLSRYMPFRPPLRFLYQYLFKLGFLDGKAGWVYCRLIAWHEWLIVLKKKELQLRQRTTQPRRATAT